MCNFGGGELVDNDVLLGNQTSLCGGGRSFMYLGKQRIELDQNL